MTPLEAMYPNRCYDCLAPCPMDKVLCSSCEQVYASNKRRSEVATADQQPFVGRVAGPDHRQDRPRP